jgi:hypothetical protein
MSLLKDSAPNNFYPQFVNSRMRKVGFSSTIFMSVCFGVSGSGSGAQECQKQNQGVTGFTFRRTSALTKGPQAAAPHHRTPPIRATRTSWSSQWVRPLLSDGTHHRCQPPGVHVHVPAVLLYGRMQALRVTMLAGVSPFTSST